MTRLRIGIAIWVLGVCAIAIYYFALREHVFHATSTRGDIYVAIALIAITLLSLLTSLFGAVVSRFRTRKYAVAKTALLLGLGAGSMLTLMVVFSQATAYTPHVDGSDPISELRQVEVNGRTEWVQLRGQNRNNPVILFLSGGPGGSQLVTSRYYFQDLEDDFTIATWEQPGAAKSFYAIGAKDITLDTYREDGAAITEYLRSEFHQDQIYVMGESWGSALGIMMANDHPDYYAGFIGTGQMVSFLDTEVIDYNLALKDARSRGDDKLVATLEEQGPPPYTESVAMKTFNYLTPLYGVMDRTGKLNSAPFGTFDGLFGVEYGLLDKFNFIWGLYTVFDAFYPKLYPVDLRETCEKLDVDVNIFQGRYDVNAPDSLVTDYYDKLTAPHKDLVYFEHSGHTAWQTESKLFNQKVREAFTPRS